MHQDFAQRRRVALAAAITVILVPAALLLNRGGADTADNPTNTLVGQALLPGQSTVPDDGDESRSGSGGTDAMGTTPPEHVLGTVPPQNNDPATIAIPRVGQSVRGIATFSRTIVDPTKCQLNDYVAIPFDSAVTVTNLDNGRSVRCIADIGGALPDEEVILSAEAFLQVGDLTDAPLSVEITW